MWWLGPAMRGRSAIDPYRGLLALYLKFDGAHDSTTFTDSSPLAKTITRNGTVRVSTTASVAGQSGYFDGSNSWLQVNSNADLDLANTPFHVEGYAAVLGGGAYQTLVDFRNSGGTLTSWDVYIRRDLGTLNVYNGLLDATVVSTPNGSLPVTGQFFHWRVSWYLGVWRLFINGVLLATATGEVPPTHSSGIRIGANRWGENDFFGYMDDLAIVVGAAGDLTTFAPSFAERPNVGPSSAEVCNPRYGATRLLLRGSTSGIVDSGPLGLAVSAVNGATISTGRVKYGDASIYLPGTTSHVVVPNNPALEFATGDFTARAWVLVPAWTGLVRILRWNDLSTTGGSPTNRDVTVELSSSGVQFFGAPASGGATTAWAATLPTNTWFFVEFTRRSGVLYAAINGRMLTVTAGTASNSTTILSTTQHTIGAGSTAGYPGTPCYIDDLAIEAVSGNTSHYLPTYVSSFAC